MFYAACGKYQHYLNFFLWLSSKAREFPCIYVFGLLGLLLDCAAHMVVSVTLGLCPFPITGSDVPPKPEVAAGMHVLTSDITGVPGVVRSRLHPALWLLCFNLHLQQPFQIQIILTFMI